LFIELTKDEYTFGRLQSCDISVKGKMPARREQVISKTHFRIYREKSVTTNGLEDDVIYLKDESQNGTFINNILIGKGNSIILVNNDLIAVAKNHFNGNIGNLIYFINLLGFFLYKNKITCYFKYLYI
jgi:pSer/pThr/pTyr-binding forkhead associated (FHA) protein